MIIKPVDKENRLFSIEQFIPDQLAEQILQVNWNNLSWVRGHKQESWKRRQLDVNDQKLFESYYDKLIENVFFIEEKLGIAFDDLPLTRWWYDEPGFLVPTHTDGHLPASMQIYWNADCDSYGTVFFEYKNEDTVKFQFKHTPNTGYIMLNHQDKDGSQPLQWHAMKNPVKTMRISNYTAFESYSME